MTKVSTETAGTASGLEIPSMVPHVTVFSGSSGCFVLPSARRRWIFERAAQAALFSIQLYRIFLY